MMREEPLLQFLVDTGVLSRETSHAVTKQAEEKEILISHVLRESGAVTDTVLQRAYAHVLGIPFIALEAHHVAPLVVLREIPEVIARQHQVIALFATPEILEVVTTQPYLSAELLPVRGRSLKLHLTDAASMRRALLSYQKLLREEFGNDIAAASQAVAPLLRREEKDVRAAAERLSTARLVDRLLQHALYQEASMLSLEPTEHELLVKYRINGVLHNAFFLPPHVAESVALRLRLLAGLPLVGPQTQGAFKMTRFEHAPEVADVLVHVSFHKTQFGTRVTVRLTSVRGQQKGFVLEALGFHGKALEDMYTALAAKGLLLVCGGEKSGRSTLLYTLADLLATSSQSVAIVDEQVHTDLPGALQITLQPELGMRYDAGVRAALAHNPTVLCVGDIPDTHTALLVLSAASRGIHVVAGMRTMSALRGIEALLHLSGSPELVAGVVRAVVATRLVRRLCPVHEVYKYSRTELTQLEESVRFPAVLTALKEEGTLPKEAAWKDVSFARAVPCPECGGGYVGYTGIHEVLPVTLVVADAIRRGEPSEKVGFLAQFEGMLTIYEDCAVLAAQGETSAEELLGLTLMDGV